MGSVDSNLDGNLPATLELFAIEGLDGLLLIFMAADIDKSVALALPWLAPAPPDNTGGDYIDTSFSEQGRQASVVDREVKVSDKEHGW